MPKLPKAGTRSKKKQSPEFLASLFNVDSLTKLQVCFEKLLEEYALGKKNTQEMVLFSQLFDTYSKLLTKKSIEKIEDKITDIEESERNINTLLENIKTRK